MGGADEGAYVLWVADAVEIHGELAARLGPTLLVDADDACPRAERAHSGQELGLDVGARTEHDSRLPTGHRSCADQILALGDEQAVALAVLSLAQPADQLQLVVVR